MRHLGVPHADRHLRDLGLFSDGEPCVLITHLLIHALTGEIECTMAEVAELERRFGIAGSPSGAYVEGAIQDFIGIARRARARGSLSGDVLLRAYQVAQVVEAIASPTNRWAVGLEGGVGLNNPTVLVKKFVGSGRIRPNPVPPLTGSEWARAVYGPLFLYSEA